MRLLQLMLQPLLLFLLHARGRTRAEGGGEQPASGGWALVLPRTAGSTTTTAMHAVTCTCVHACVRAHLEVVRGHGGTGGAQP